MSCTRIIRSAAALALTLLLAPARSVCAQDGWKVEAGALFMDALGNDRHVLTARTVTGTNSSATDVLLDSDEALGHRASVSYERGGWIWGFDFLMFRTDQAVAPVSAAADGAGGRRVFEVAGRSFTSTRPNEALYFRTLEDTTIELWTADLWAARPLVDGPSASLDVLAGLRNADFDNDLRAVAGLGDVGGVRLDASSNYSRMMGPLVGMIGRFEAGRHTLRGEVRQSVVWGEVELSRFRRDFAGPPGPFAGPPEEIPEGSTRDELRARRDIAVPMTDVRVGWSCRLGRRFELGLDLAGTAWWNLAVPPGVVPGREESLEETTLVTYGAGASFGVRF